VKKKPGGSDLAERISLRENSGEGALTVELARSNRPEREKAALVGS